MKDKREYETRKSKMNGKECVRVSLSYKGVNYLDKKFNSVDEAVKVADMTIIKNNLPYFTKRFKKVDKK